MKKFLLFFNIIIAIVVVNSDVSDTTCVLSIVFNFHVMFARRLLEDELRERLWVEADR